MSAPFERHGEFGGSSQFDPETGRIVATCMWEGCDAPGRHSDRLALIPPGSTVSRIVTVAVCPRHRLEWRASGRFLLYTHPDNILGI